jgi:hypothetical protein
LSQNDKLEELETIRKRYPMQFDTIFTISSKCDMYKAFLIRAKRRDKGCWCLYFSPSLFECETVDTASNVQKRYRIGNLQQHYL